MVLGQEVRELREEVEKIKARNKRVEADKAWETSYARTSFIAITTFVLAYILMLLINEGDPFWKAIVGTILYIISTSTYGALKTWWLKKSRRN